MRIGLMSDTHDNLPMIRKALARFADAGVDCIIHAGDFVAPFALAEILKFHGTVYGVFGNNDGERAGLRKLLADLSEEPRRINLCERNITVVHDEGRLKKSDIRESDVLVVGHTHDAEIRAGRPLVVNPGECGGWLSGRSTVAILDSETLEAKILKVGKT
jgi:hypothetical protein